MRSRSTSPCMCTSARAPPWKLMGSATTLLLTGERRRPSCSRRVPAAVCQPGDGRSARHRPLLQPPGPRHHGQDAQRHWRDPHHPLAVLQVRNFIKWNESKVQEINLQSNLQIHGHWRLCRRRHRWSLLLLVPDRPHRPPDVFLAADQPHAVLRLPRAVQGHLLRDLPGARGHDHGAVRAGHHRDGQRPELRVWEPVPAGHAPMGRLALHLSNSALPSLPIMTRC